MFQLKYLECRDFFSFEDLAIKFNNGITLITGYDESGKDSNGSGKSTILNAICWALFGKTLKGVSGQDVVRWGAKDCKVVLILQNNGTVYEIERTLGTLSFKINGSRKKGNKSDIQATIETAFKTNYALFVRSTAFTQSQVEFLAASGDADKKKLFKEILSLARLDKAYERIKLLYDSAFISAERKEQELENIAAGKWKLEDRLHDTEELLTDWQRRVEDKVRELELRKSNKPIPAEQIQNKLEAVNKKLASFVSLDEDIREVEEKQIQLDTEKLLRSKEIEKLWKIIQEGQVVGSRCEACGSAITKKTMRIHLKEKEDKIEELLKANNQTASDMEVLSAQLLKLNQMEGKRRGLEDARDEINRELAKNILDWEYYNEFCEDVDRQITEVQNADPYSNIVVSLRTELDLVNNQLYELQTEFKNTKKRIDTLAFLKKVLAREGVVGHIIEHEFASLVSWANRYLSGISGGKLQLLIQPQRELKSGALKEEIDILVFLDGKQTTYWGLSDGQRQRLNIALLLALNKLCKTKGVNSFDFLLLDEVLDISLAEGGQQDVLFLLKLYQRECPMIIVISHKEAFKASFTSCISVYRDSDGISHLAR